MALLFGFLGLMIACVGLGNPAAFPRFTFGNTELLGGIGLLRKRKPPMGIAGA